jgi:hypothetical protein
MIYILQETRITQTEEFETDPHGYIKIGWTEYNPHGRQICLQSGNPRELKCLGVFEGTRRFEKYIHEYLSDFRVKGEWFDCGALDLLKKLDLKPEWGMN